MRKYYALPKLLLMGIFIVGPASTLSAQDEPDLGWSYQAQLSTVWAGGNSESNTLGFRSTIKHIWENASLTFSGGAHRTESSIKTRRAVGTVESFTLEEKTTTETTAEALFGRAKLSHNLNDRIHTLAGADWLRNTFSGIDSRFLLSAGAGVTLSDTKQLSANADFSVTYTFEEEVVAKPAGDNSFAGLRAGYSAKYQASKTTQFESELVGDWNLGDTDDLRLEWTNAMSVAINSSLALKPSTLIQWRNDPALASVKLFDADGEAIGNTVVVPLEKADWFLDLAIVLTL